MQQLWCGFCSLRVWQVPEGKLGRLPHALRVLARKSCLSANLNSSSCLPGRVRWLSAGFSAACVRISQPLVPHPWGGQPQCRHTTLGSLLPCILAPRALSSPVFSGVRPSGFHLAVLVLSRIDWLQGTLIITGGRQCYFREK